MHCRRVLHRDLKARWDVQIYWSSCKSFAKLSLVVCFPMLVILLCLLIHCRNIFLRKNDIKIGDFGISRILMGTADMATTFTGTPYYMSPEVLKHEGYNSKSDVWYVCLDLNLTQIADLTQSKWCCFCILCLILPPRFYTQKKAYQINDSFFRLPNYQLLSFSANSAILSYFKECALLQVKVVRKTSAGKYFSGH